MWHPGAQRFPPAPDDASTPGPNADAPGPNGAEGAAPTDYDNIIDYLSDQPEFTELVQLINAAPSSADLQSMPLTAHMQGSRSLCPVTDYYASWFRYRALEAELCTLCMHLRHQILLMLHV